jgi:uncharacterized protein
MILRQWKANADPHDCDAYPTYFNDHVLPTLRRCEGFLGAEVLRREQGTAIEYVVTTRWTSMTAVAAFAGSDPSRAVVEPEAAALLRDYDRTVEHYEVVASSFANATGVPGHHLLRYDLAPDYVERRPLHRDDHLILAWKSAEAGTLVLGGAVGDPVESALLLFTDADAAAAFARSDPYVQNGLVLAWQVVPWRTAVGNNAADPVRPDPSY